MTVSSETLLLHLVTYDSFHLEPVPPRIRTIASNFEEVLIWKIIYSPRLLCVMDRTEKALV